QLDEVVEARDGIGQVGLCRGGHEAELGVEVGALFALGERMPAIVPSVVSIVELWREEWVYASRWQRGKLKCHLPCLSLQKLLTLWLWALGPGRQSTSSIWNNCSSSQREDRSPCQDTGQSNHLFFFLLHSASCKKKKRKG